MRYVCARASPDIQASERAAFAPESHPQGRNGADVELPGVRQKGEVHQVRGRFTSTPVFLICELGGLESNVAAQRALLRSDLAPENRTERVRDPQSSRFNV